MLRKAVLAVTSLVAFSVGQTTNAMAVSVEEMQAYAAEVIRPQLPIQVDAVSTWYAVASEGRTLVYTYGLQVQRSDIDTDRFEAAMRESLQSSACGQANMVEIMELGGNYKYVYTGQNGNLIGSVTISEEDC